MKSEEYEFKQRNDRGAQSQAHPASNFRQEVHERLPVEPLHGEVEALEVELEGNGVFHVLLPGLQADLVNEIHQTVHI